MISGGRRHEWVDDHRDRPIRPDYFGTHAPIICLHCGAQTWRNKGTGRIQISDSDEDGFPKPTTFLRSLNYDELGCEYFIVKRIMDL